MMNNKFTESELNELSFEIKEHFEKLVQNGNIVVRDDGYYFASLDDPYMEQSKHKFKVLEYVVWNLAAQTYLEVGDE